MVRYLDKQRRNYCSGNSLIVVLETFIILYLLHILVITVELREDADVMFPMAPVAPVHDPPSDVHFLLELKDCTKN